MKFRIRFYIPILLVFLLLPGLLSAQRKVEKLGRGVVATNLGNGNVYVSWRFFAQDPTDIGFNVYRSVGGAAAVKRNATPIKSLLPVAPPCFEQENWAERLRSM